MDLSGLAEHLATVEDEAAIRLDLGSRTYLVREPGYSRGLRCVAAWAAHGIEDRDDQVTALEAALQGKTLAQLALGDDVAAQMDADDVSASVINECALIALARWAAGPERAQRILDAIREKRAGGAAAGKARTGSRRPRKSGTRSGTASASE